MATDYLEKSILQKVDQLIDIIIEVSSAKENYASLKNEAIKKALELIPLLLYFLEGNIIHVESMFYQLIMEKLPDPRIFTSFGNFQQELNIIIKEAIITFQKSPEHYIIEDDNHSPEVLRNSLQSTVFKAFPALKVLFNYQIRGQTLEAYIPSLKIAFISENKKSSFVKLNYLCKKLGIRLIQVPKEISGDHRRLIRFIKRTNI